MKINNKILWFCFSLVVMTGVLFQIRVSIMSAAEINLAWDSNSETDIQGYGVYKSTGSPGPPYELIDFLAVIDLEDPDHPELVITDLENDQKYYFAVTAYDTEGCEGAFSNEVCIELIENHPQECNQDNNLENIAGRGGGGGTTKG